jgi:hypothetical protein
MSELPGEVIVRVLTSCLPPGSPLSFRRIESAQFVGQGRSRKAVGRVEMFDGQPASVEVFCAGQMLGVDVWGHEWTEMAGGACFLEDGEWHRTASPQSPLLPDEAAVTTRIASGTAAPASQPNPWAHGDGYFEGNT